MSSHQQNMAQKLWDKVLQRYSIVAPAPSTRSMWDTTDDIPHGIPALFEFSKRHSKTSALDRVMAKLSQARHIASMPEVRFAAVACGLLYMSRHVISSIGDEMNDELLDWIFPERTTVSLTAADLQQMHDDADRVQVRIRGLETQIQVERDSRTEVWQEGERIRESGEKAKEDMDKLQAEIAALKEQLEVQSTKTHDASGDEQSTSQVLPNEQDLTLDGQLESSEESEAASVPQQGDAQADLAEGDEDKEETSKVERLQIQLEKEQENYRLVFKKKEVFRLGGKKLKEVLEKVQADYKVLEDGTELKKNFDDLQADYNKLEDDRDTWREKYEALEKEADVQTATDLRNQIASDNTHHERQIQGLVTQLECEKTSREEAETNASELRASCKNLKAELKAANKKCGNLGTSSAKLDNEDGTETTNEDKDEDPTDWKAEYERLEVEFADLEDRYDRLNAERAGTTEDTHESQQSEEADFDPLYDNSDRDKDGDDKDGDDKDGDDRAGSEGHGEDQANEDTKPDTSNDGEDSSSDDDFDDMPNYGHRTMLRTNASAPDPSGYDLVVVPPQSPVNSAERFAAHSPAFKAPGTGNVKNAHVRAVNEDAMRKNWRRKSGMPDVDEQVILAPEDEVEIEGMFQRQIIQAYTPILAFTTFPPSFTDILDAPEMRAARRTISPAQSQAREDNPRAEASEDSINPVDAPKMAATQPVPNLDGSEKGGADENDESEGEWVDDDEDDNDDDNDDDDKDSMPMLGNHKVTRPKPSKNDAEEPMLGNHRVTRAPTPSNEDSEEAEVTLDQAPATGESRKPVDEEEVSHVEGSLEEDKEGGEVGGEDEGKEEKEGGGVDKEEEKGSGNDPQPSLPEPLPAGACASNTSPPAVRPTSDGSQSNFPHGRQRPRRPSNFFPGEANATKTLAEEVGDALVDYLNNNPTLKLSESMWANTPDEKSQIVVPQEASPLSPPPGAPVGPRIGQVGPAPPRGPSTSNNGPTSQPPPGAPTGPRGHVSRDPVQGRRNGGANQQAAPFGGQSTPGTASRNDGWSPRGDARRGRQPGRAPNTPPTPLPAAAGNNNNANRNQYPAAGRRGGRGGRGAHTPRAGPTRGGRSAAMESFLRQNLGKKDE